MQSPDIGDATSINEDIMATMGRLSPSMISPASMIENPL
jgi:hypothetical protein